SPSGDSTLITSAPMSASSRPAKGPAGSLPNSITRTPLSGRNGEDMEAKLPPRLGIVILMGIAVAFASNHISARIAFDHGASVVTGVFARSLFTPLDVFALLRLQVVPVALSRAQLGRTAIIG